MRSTPYSPATLRRVRNSKKWAATARHEAGHAVVSVALGRAVRQVRLTPGNADRLGVCEGFPDRGEFRELGPSYWSPRKVRAQVLVLLAGDIAEKRFDRTRRFGGHGDYDLVCDIIFSAFGSGDASDRCRRWADDCDRLVTKHLPQIRAVAEALLASDSLALTGRQIREICKRSVASSHLAG